VLPAVFIYFKLLKYNKLVLNLSVNLKSKTKLKEVKNKAGTKIYISILQNISFIYTILIIAIGLRSLYNYNDHNIVIIFGIFCAVILDAFSHFNLPKYEKLLLSKGERVKRAPIKSISNLYKEAAKVALNKMVISLFILLGVIMPTGMVVTTIAMFIYYQEYILTLLFAGIAIIMFVSLFVAMIYYISNLSFAMNEKKDDYSLGVITVVVFCLYYFGDKNKE
jgi:hypothetical protein